MNSRLGRPRIGVVSWITLACLLVSHSCLVLSAQTPYQVAHPGYRYEFPRDHFDHPAYQTEWWYYTGNLIAKDGHRFGFELTFFRQAVDRDAGKDRAWDLKDLYLAHLALSDLDGGIFYHTERLNRSGPGLAGVSQSEGKIWNGNWQVHWQGEEQQLQAVAAEFALSFGLHPEKPPVIQGENGVSQKGAAAGQASQYISLTRIATRGEISVHGKSYEVSGVTWMDHEFFSSQPDSTLLGWDWLSIQLTDRTELMLYHFRRKNGASDPFSSGTYIDAQGRTTHLRAEDFTLRPVGATWKSPATGAVYPIAWEIRIPSLSIAVESETSLPSQELTGESRLAPSYWEGAIALHGSLRGQPITGVGYLELTGYDRPLEIP
jgi:predicted secreted hydrolase